MNDASRTLADAPRTVNVPATPFAGQPAPNRKTKSKIAPAVERSTLEKDAGKGKKGATTVHDNESDVPSDYSGYGYVETDDEYAEAQAAKQSPAKHGHRLTSAVCNSS